MLHVSKWIVVCVCVCVCTFFFFVNLVYFLVIWLEFVCFFRFCAAWKAICMTITLHCTIFKSPRTWQRLCINIFIEIFFMVQSSILKFKSFECASMRISNCAFYFIFLRLCCINVSCMFNFIFYFKRFIFVAAGIKGIFIFNAMLWRDTCCQCGEDSFE